MHKSFLAPNGLDRHSSGVTPEIRPEKFRHTELKGMDACIFSSFSHLNYMQIKQLIDRKVVENKWGTLTQREIQNLVQELHDCQQERELEQGTAEKEMDAMQKKIQRNNVEQLVGILTEREDGLTRILVCQMGGCASVEMREIKSRPQKD